MLSLSIDRNDSPKFYFSFQDIYGNALAIEREDLVELKYSVSKMVAGRLYPVENYENLDIPIANWKSEPEPYPRNIVGTSASGAGYNLELFPYSNENGEWKSPFSEPNTVYYLAATIAYYMSDPALTDAALFRRSISVKITTGSV